MTVDGCCDDPDHGFGGAKRGIFVIYTLKCLVTIF